MITKIMVIGKFMGRNSNGYAHGNMYEISVSIEYDWVLIKHRNNTQMNCVYSSWKAFIINWSIQKVMLDGLMNYEKVISEPILSHIKPYIRISKFNKITKI